MTKPDLLLIGDYPGWDMQAFQAGYTCHHSPLDQVDAALASRLRAVAFKDHIPFTAQMMDQLPSLGLIANFGVGYDAIDTQAATARGIKVTNTPDVLTDDVADLAVGMLLAITRNMVQADTWVRSGDWARRGPLPLNRTVTGKRVGIVGLGRIGRAIAERLVAFKTPISYYSRTPKKTPSDWSYHADITQMAAQCDALVVALSGGPDTAGLITAAALKALGPEGTLINISRGSTVDEAALLTALETGTLGAAALDVFATEPACDPRFATLKNTVLQPHQASATIETRQAMGQLQRDNLDAFFADKPLITPVN